MSSLEKKDVLGVASDAELLDELKKKENDNNSARENEEDWSLHAKIRKVMYFLQQSNDELKTHFSPREISIGPLCSKKRWVKKELKLKLAKKLFRDSGKTPDSFLTEIKNHIGEIRKCFGEEMINPIWYNDDSLSRLFFLDGCAVLQFIRSNVSGELGEFNINSTEAAFIQQDLFLFENQIPFKVLTLLMDVMDEDMIDKKAEKPSDQFRACILPFVHENNVFATKNLLINHREDDHLKLTNKVLDKIRPVHLLDLLWKVSIFGSFKDVEPMNCVLTLDSSCGSETQKRNPKRSLRSVQELKSCGITMKLNNSCCLKSVSFGTHHCGVFGHLKLPALNVNDSTVRKLLNLVAYELCLDVKERCYSVTSYLNFLDVLIDTEQDVKDLRTARILRSALGSDAKVAEFFNTLQLTYLPKSDQDHFEKIQNKIEEHYARKWKIRMAQIYTAYVRNPWPTLGLLLTLIALLFTVVQTWFAINPRGS